MNPRPRTPRIPPVAIEDMSPDAQEMLRHFTTRAGIPNLYRILINYEGLVRRWLPFGAKVLNGKIPLRDRELLILRTGWLCQSPYEWSQHVVLGLANGLSREEIERVKLGPDAEWSDFDRALLRAADDLHFDCCISDEVWSILAERYDKKQLIELPMLVGEYHLVAITLNSLGVPLDDDLTDEWDWNQASP
jgi:4-carboxymuconolactone decarboxylase